VDFDLTEEQSALTELADRILADHCGPQRLAGLEKDALGSGLGSVHDGATWQALADAGVISALFPEPDGGGLGVLGLALLAEAAGKRTAYLPVVACLALGALPVAKLGGDRALLAAVAAGKLLLTGALEEPGEPAGVTTMARAVAGGYVIDGAKTMVPYGDVADRILIPVSIDGEGDGETAILIVPREAMDVTPLLTTGRQPYADLELRGVRVGADALLARGPGVVERVRDLGTLGYAAEAAGVCGEAVRMTAKYTSTRKQFGEPIASFQAVGQRAADAYISAEVIRLTMLHAAWLLDDEYRDDAAGSATTASERTDTAAAVAIAKFHAGDAGSRVLHACQHLHGGIGVDTDYPLHRYFVRGKQIEQTLGTATRQLLRIGAHLAEH
jgi:alkylation response protein AidB-like acyl-CoA dehydrogenase